MNKRHIFLLFFGILILPSFLFGKPLEDITLQLRWLHQFQFAGYYMAKEKGYYRKAGLNVTILEANDKHPHPVEEVIEGRAQYGVGNSGLINERLNGKPVVVLAALFQTSPNVWILRKDSHISSIIDMVDKRLMMTKNIENAELLALFYNEGINIDKLNIIESTFNIDELISRKVDAFNGYSTNEPYYLKQQGIDYVTIDPRKYGVDFYSDCLFTSDNEVSQYPQRVNAFREASLHGWVYALAHPEETIDVILAHYSKLKTRDHLRFEAAEIRKLMVPELIEVGHMNPSRWDYIAQTYYRLGFISTARIPNGFIYNPNPTKDYTWLYYSLALSLALLLIIGLIAWTIYRLNCKIKEQSIRDPLTGLYNRRYLDETLQKEIVRAQRERIPLSVVIIDLDHFKAVNDTYGHAAGDAVLQSIATYLIGSIRQNDFVCRYGGEEFILVMPGMPIDQASLRMEQCRKEIQNMTILYNTHQISITMSGGIAMFNAHGTLEDELLKAADDALYMSKVNGRNQITLAQIKEV
ncbi:MAG: diguanylate cyclase [Pseudomonadota bacterium]